MGIDMDKVRLKDLRIVRVDSATFRRFLLAHHRHNPEEVGWKFIIGVAVGDRLCGVASAGRPKARHLDDGTTLEITRVCTDGTKNAASCLLGRARSLIFGMGYEKAITYTRADELGSSLEGAGFTVHHRTKAQDWNRPQRPRERRDIIEKVCWVSQSTLDDHKVDLNFEQALTFAQRRRDLEEQLDRLDEEEMNFYQPETMQQRRYELGLDVSEASEPHECGQHCTEDNCDVEARGALVEGGLSGDQAQRWLDAAGGPG